MYGIFTYIWAIFKANVGKYSIHGAYGLDQIMTNLGNPSVASVVAIGTSPSFRGLTHMKVTAWSI